MKFYLVELTTTTGEASPAKGVYEYDDLNTAVANFHSKLGSQMKNVNCESEMCLVINESGATQKVEFYDVRPVPEPEPEPEPEPSEGE